MRIVIELIDPQQNRAADDQRKAHPPGIEQIGLDVAAGGGADHGRGQERHQHADDEAPVVGIGKHPKRDPPQFGEIDGENRKNRAELNQHGETLPEPAFAEIEKSLRQQQMTGGGHREEFRDALDDAEDHRPYCIRHHDPVRYDRYRPKKPGSSRLFALPPQRQNAKTRVASFVCFYSLAPHSGGESFLSTANLSRTSCSHCSIIRSVRIRALSGLRSANTASTCGWWKSGYGSGARHFWR